MEKTILVVDDSRFAYEAIELMVKDSNYKIVGYAKDAEQLLKLYEELKPDIVTMDIILPGIDGLDATRLLINKFSDARVVIVSSLAYDETKENAEQVGACGFVFKPLEEKEFLEALDHAVENNNGK